MGIAVTILGSNSAIPTANRRPTAQIVSVDQQYYLVDCGEGTQIQLRKYGFKFQRISRIFISHLHGDHYFGLIGLINTMHLLGREKELHIHAPKDLQKIIQLQMEVVHARLRFDLFFHDLESEVDLIFENKLIEVHKVAVDHRVPCFGFVFQEKEKELKINKIALNSFQLSFQQIIDAKQGKDIVLDDGNLVRNKEITLPPIKPLKYSFITDTKPNKNYYSAIEGSDLLYHEATFTSEMAKRAKETHHSTAEQAAQIAIETGVKKLIIGHFSTRYKNLDPLLKEAKSIFRNTELAVEGETFNA